MHLPNGAVTPLCALIGTGVAGAITTFAAVAARKARLAHPWRLALAAGAVLSAQALNVRVLPTSSGHLVGAFLLAYYFGSTWGSIAMTLVLALQAMVYGDGSLATLGLNAFNLAILPCWMIFPLWQRWCPGRSLLLVAAAAFASTLLAAVALGLQLGSAATILPHIPAALLEAAGTVGVILLVRHAHRVIFVPASMVLLVAAAFGASPYPDGLEISMERLGVLLPKIPGPLDYSLLPLLSGAVLIALSLRALALLSNNTRGELQ